MLAKLNHRFRDQMRGRPGHRFQDRYERAKKTKNKGTGVRRIINLVLALIAFVVGVIFVVIPGPGIPFLVIAGGLMASESRAVARALDWCELKLQPGLKWGRAHWKRFSAGEKIAAVSAMTCCGVGMTVAFWWFVRK